MCSWASYLLPEGREGFPALSDSTVPMTVRDIQEALFVIPATFLAISALTPAFPLQWERDKEHHKRERDKELEGRAINWPGLIRRSS